MRFVALRGFNLLPKNLIFVESSSLGYIATSRIKDLDLDDVKPILTSCL
jgi:hypothetical protein